MLQTSQRVSQKQPPSTDPSATHCFRTPLATSMRTPLLPAASVAARRCSTLHAKHAQIRYFH